MNCKVKYIFGFINGRVDYFINRKEYSIAIYELIDCLDFLEDIKLGNICNFDGYIQNILVDGNITNLGLAEGDIVQGEFIVDGNFLKEFCNLKLEEYNSFKHKENYGLCDNVEQVFKEYPEINCKERKFFIVLTKVNRKDQAKENGFRYHKFGKYIGDLNPQYEYLYDDKHIEYVIIYHIYEIK